MTQFHQPFFISPKKDLDGGTSPSSRKLGFECRCRGCKEAHVLIVAVHGLGRTCILDLVVVLLFFVVVCYFFCVFVVSKGVRFEPTLEFIKSAKQDVHYTNGTLSVEILWDSAISHLPKASAQDSAMSRCLSIFPLGVSGRLDKAVILMGTKWNPKVMNTSQVCCEPAGHHVLRQGFLQFLEMKQLWKSRNHEKSDGTFATSPRAESGAILNVLGDKVSGVTQAHSPSCKVKKV